MFLYTETDYDGFHRQLKLSYAKMDKIDTLKTEIEKTRTILKESQENYARNPGDYSAQLLLLTTETYLADLLKELDKAQSFSE